MTFRLTPNADSPSGWSLALGRHDVLFHLRPEGSEMSTVKYQLILARFHAFRAMRLCEALLAASKPKVSLYDCLVAACTASGVSIDKFAAGLVNLTEALDSANCKERTVVFTNMTEILSRIIDDPTPSRTTTDWLTSEGEDQ